MVGVLFLLLFSLYLHPMDTPKGHISYLLDAVDQGNIDLAREAVLEKGVNPNEANYIFTPLEEAASRGNIPMCRFLLKNGTNASAVNIIGQTAIHSAAFHHKYEAIWYLVKQHGVDVNAGKSHLKVLDMAAIGSVTRRSNLEKYNQLKTISTLLICGANEVKVDLALLKEGADLLRRKDPLHDGRVKKQAELLKRLDMQHTVEDVVDNVVDSVVQNIN